MKTKLLTLFVALIATTALWASNTITYTASDKLTSSFLGVGETTFGSAITSHTFSEGIGTITCNGEITTVGFCAFLYCREMTSVTIPNSVTTIGNDAFYSCSGLTSITIPNSVTTIGKEAFMCCGSLTSIEIPNSVTTIEDNAFYWCKGLISINVDASNTHYCSTDGVLFNYTKDTLIQYPLANTRTEYTIPSSVITIVSGAFSGCWDLTSVTIPNSVTTIGNEAFGYCSGLTSITIPNSVTTIGSYAFYDCIGLTSISIGTSVTTIGERAFQFCSALTLVTIPNSVTTIGGRAFYLCTSLTSIDVDAANTHYRSIDGVLFNYAKDTLIQHPEANTRTEYSIPNSVTTIGDAAFFGCDDLTSVTIPNSVTTIENSAFSDCSDLTTITIPNSVTTIGKYAFYDCSDLTTITIPNSVTTIGNSAFSWCTSLTSIVVHWTDALELPTMGDKVFNNIANQVGPSTATLHVPSGTKNIYETADVWKDFGTILDDATALPNVLKHGSQYTMHKVLRNGQILLERNNATYTLTGQKVL